MVKNSTGAILIIRTLLALVALTFSLSQHSRLVDQDFPSFPVMFVISGES
jgi:hypothetical protein